MRLAVCALSAVLLSGCSWGAGYGAGAGFGQAGYGNCAVLARLYLSVSKFSQEQNLTLAAI